MPRLLIDTNILCLLAVGRLGREQISRHKRLRAYSAADFDLLLDVMSRFSGIVTTPHVLAESSNLLSQSQEPLATAARRSLAELTATLDERMIPAVLVVQRPEYGRLGLTDSGILDLLDKDCLLISADLGLYLASEAAGFPAINFNHLRDGAISL